MCTYPGANAQVVAESVAAPIEQQVNGVEDMIYMSSQSNNDGTYTLTVTFKPGVNLNFAQVLVQNRINLALPLLPDVVKQAGVTTRKRNPDILQVVSHLLAQRPLRPALSEQLRHHQDQGRDRPRGRRRRLFSSSASRTTACGIWVDPDTLAALNLTAADVANAVREQNMPGSRRPHRPAARPPAKQLRVHHHHAGPADQYPSSSRTSSSRTDARRPQVLRSRTSAMSSSGPRTWTPPARSIGSRIGQPGHLCSCPTPTPSQTADRVRAKMDELKKSFPRGHRLRRLLRHDAVHPGVDR